MKNTRKQVFFRLHLDLLYPNRRFGPLPEADPMRADDDSKRGIPDLRGTEHIGFTVPDLDQATRFFVDVIGCEWVYSLGPMRDSGEWMATHLNVHARAEVRELRF